MAYSTNNKKVAIEVAVAGYMYNILSPFTANNVDYDSITLENYRRLLEPERAARVDAFYDYVNTDYYNKTGIVINARSLVQAGKEDIVLDTNECAPVTYYEVYTESEYATTTPSYTSGVLNTVITIKAVPDEDSREFLGWFEKDTDVLVSELEETLYVITKDVTLEARYSDELKVYIVAVENPDYIAPRGSAGGTGYYVKGDTAILTAYAEMGYVFEGWKDKDNLGAGFVSTAQTWNYTVGEEDKTFYAFFKSYVPEPVKENLYVRARVEAYGGIGGQLIVDVVDQFGNPANPYSTLVVTLHWQGDSGGGWQGALPTQVILGYGGVYSEGLPYWVMAEPNVVGVSPTSDQYYQYY